MSESITNMLSGMFDDVCFLMCVDEDREKLDVAIKNPSAIMQDLKDARIVLMHLSNIYRKKYPELVGEAP